ncbi:MAG: hypothetical protein QM703_24450 [Gemmatales bacterium]
MLILAGVAAWFTGCWLNQPLWQIEEARPVSFDKVDAARKEWTTLTGDADRKNWWIETRAGRDPTVIRRLKLELPPLKGQNPYLSWRIFLKDAMPCDAIVCYQSVEDLSSTKREFIVFTFFIVSQRTGNVVRSFRIVNNPYTLIAGYGSKLAFVEGDYIKLFDVATNTERSISVRSEAACLEFSPDGKLLGCVSKNSTVLNFIDWDKAVLIEPVTSKKPVTSFSFITNDTLLLAHDQPLLDADSFHARWRWDGKELKQISPGIKLKSRQSLPVVKMTANGELHLSFYAVTDWPLRFKSLLQWLADKKIPIEKWVHRQIYDHWVVLDDQDRLQREYYEEDRYLRRVLYDQLSVEVEPDKQFTTSTITFRNEHPVWPNALAVGVVIYLLLYVMMLVRQSWSTR